MSDRTTYIPFDKALTPTDGMVRVFANWWWLVHPEKGLMFWRRQSIWQAATALERTHPLLCYWNAPLEVRQFSAVFIPITAGGGFTL